MSSDRGLCTTNTKQDFHTPRIRKNPITRRVNNAPLTPFPLHDVQLLVSGLENMGAALLRGELALFCRGRRILSENVRAKLTGIDRQRQLPPSIFRQRPSVATVHTADPSCRNSADRSASQQTRSIPHITLSSSPSTVPFVSLRCSSLRGRKQPSHKEDTSSQELL